MEASFYSSAEWRRVRERVRARDGNRCTVGRLLGGGCHGLLHVHHIDPAGDPLDEDLLATVCASCHPRWERLRRQLLAARDTGWRRCPHRHRYAHARRECERKLNAGRIAA